MATEKKPPKSGPFCGRKAEIIIHKDSNKHAINPVPVAVEGVQFTIRRGEKVIVPIEIVEALEHAVETRYESELNKDMSTTMEPREVLSYPFSVLREL